MNPVPHTPLESVSSSRCSGVLPSALSAQERALEGTVDTPIGKLTFEDGYPSNASVEKLYDTLDFQRACQAYIWGLPLMATQAFSHSFRADLGGERGDLIEVTD